MALAEEYQRLIEEARRLFHGERDLLANQANAASLLLAELPAVNWVGFYRRVGEELLLGPFQGKPACTRIALGKGVCGRSAGTGRTVVVSDVATFPGYIACDPQTQSEIVVPLVRGGRVIGVLDCDSPQKGRFTDSDRIGLEAFVEVLLRHSDEEKAGA